MPLVSCVPATMPAMPTLHYLEFDEQLDTSGLRSWSALASPAAGHASALQTEVRELLADLTHRLGEPGPVDEGHLWDMALQTQQDADRITLSLDLTGTDALAACLSDWQTSFNVS